MDRRHFIGSAALSTLASLASPMLSKLRAFPLTAMPENSDAALCKEKFDIALSRQLAERPINEVIVEIAKTFIGTNYVDHVLEATGPEHLVVNLRALDCVSFYENSLALALCIKLKSYTFDNFKTELQRIRYRSGIIDGYPSRLHYTTDYWFDGEKKGVLKVVTKDLFGEKNVHLLPTPINFMSTHRSSYQQLADDAVCGSIRKQEEEISKREVFFLPKGNLHIFAERIKTGSLIGITTNVSGLDVSHTGIAIRLETGALHLLHAPDIGYKVQITEKPLHDYLALHPRQTGIIVAEAVDPK